MRVLLQHLSITLLKCVGEIEWVDICPSTVGKNYLSLVSSKIYINHDYLIIHNVRIEPNFWSMDPTPLAAGTSTKLAPWRQRALSVVNMLTIKQNDPHSTLILCHIALDAKHYISRTLLFEYEGKTYPLGERLSYLKRIL